MSKIYKALENARREKERDAVPVRVETAPLEMESEMVALYHSISALLPDIPQKVIQLIGSREGEGSSTITAAFAKFMVTKLNLSVLVLNADIQKPLHVLLNKEPEYSLENVLNDHVPLEKALNRVDNLNLYVSALSGHCSSVPPVFDILTKEYFSDKMQQFDIILVDSPPATGSAECMILARMVHGTVIVVEAEKTRWPVAENVKERILKNGGKVLGMVLNKRRFHIPDFLYKRL